MPPDPSKQQQIQNKLKEIAARLGKESNTAEVHGGMVAAPTFQGPAQVPVVVQPVQTQTNQFAAFPPQPMQTNQLASFPPQPGMIPNQWTAVTTTPNASGGWQNVQSTETRLPASFAPVTAFSGPAPVPMNSSSFPAPKPIEVTEHKPKLKSEPVTVHVSVNSEKDEEFKQQTNSLVHPSRARRTGGGTKRSSPVSRRPRYASKSPPPRRRSPRRSPRKRPRYRSRSGSRRRSRSPRRRRGRSRSPKGRRRSRSPKRSKPSKSRSPRRKRSVSKSRSPPLALAVKKERKYTSESPEKPKKKPKSASPPSRRRNSSPPRRKRSSRSPPSRRRNSTKARRPRSRTPPRRRRSYRDDRDRRRDRGDRNDRVRGAWSSDKFKTDEKGHFGTRGGFRRTNSPDVWKHDKFEEMFGDELKREVKSER